MGVADHPVRVRMAPSPTGFVHLGSARTALFNLLFARANGGVFVLRIEDTDLERGSLEYENAIYEGFRWLGLDWDEGPDVGGPHGPYRQSERLDVYREHAGRLIAAGAAYRCYCTPEELDAERRHAEREKRPYKYSRRCLREDLSSRHEFAVRFKVPPGRTTFTDAIRGEMDFDNDLIGDPVIVKSNSFPTYNFAAPVDDALMRITHVLRAEEHLPNTPVQLMILDALGMERPAVYGHLPQILGKDRSKLSKRKHPEARLSLYREQGYLPEALINYMALLGWNPGTEQEIFSFAELVGAFSLERVQKAGAVFDWVKLDWIDGEYIRALGNGELAHRLMPFLPELDAASVERAAPAVKERIEKLSKARELLDYLWEGPPPPELNPDAVSMVREAIDPLAEVEWTPDAIHSLLERIREERGWSRGKFFSALRLSVARPISPPIHDTLALLSKEEALRRLRRAAA
jgi:glutamyl-tRNA synthetase